MRTTRARARMLFFRKHRTDRRGAYRVETTRDEGRLWIGLSSGRAEAVLEDISARGLACTVAGGDVDRMREGDSVPLLVRIGGKAAGKLRMRGTIRSVQRLDAELARIGVEFEDVERVFPQLEADQWRYFNRRSAFRVPPLDAEGRPVEAEFSVAGVRDAVRLPLFDLSSSGIGLSFKPADAPDLPREGLVRVRFVLEGVERTFDLMVRFVHRTAVGDRVRVGLRIDVEATADGERQCEEIADYVIGAQRQQLAE
ncbi:MAG: PilZ domain-containing protein [Planctomycetota bacterium]